jgi:Fe-S-cluster containining protein
MLEEAEDATPLSLTIGVRGRPVAIRLSVPSRPVRLDQLLPALRQMDDRLVDAVVAAAEAGGERVSCAKGCSACCRVQPVPVTPPEAYALARLVEKLPEPRRTAVRAAFADAVQKLREAGLYDAYMNRNPEMSREEALSVVRRYMALRLTCPFLENDACGIYDDRPFVCRQYLVTSPPALCDGPLDNPVKPVAVAATFATAMLDVGEALAGRPQYSAPLVLALEQAEAHRAELERLHEPRAVFERIVRGALE